MSRHEVVVAWLGEDTDQGLADALTFWFGEPIAGQARS